MEILLRSEDLPREEDIDSDIEWLCHSTGFFEETDQNKTAVKIVKIILKNAGNTDGIKSKEIAKRTNMSRGAVVNHLNRMIKSGLVAHKGTRYKLRCSTIYDTIQELESDVERVFKNMKKVAWEIDSSLGYPTRKFER